jgi:hypothetical protein
MLHRESKEPDILSKSKHPRNKRVAMFGDIIKGKNANILQIETTDIIWKTSLKFLNNNKNLSALNQTNLEHLKPLELARRKLLVHLSSELLSTLKCCGLKLC